MADSIYLTAKEAVATLEWNVSSVREAIELISERWEREDKFIGPPTTFGDRRETAIAAALRDAFSRRGQELFRAHAAGKIKLLGQRCVRAGGPLEPIGPISNEYLGNSVRLYAGGFIAGMDFSPPSTASEHWYCVQMLRSEFHGFVDERRLSNNSPR